MCRGGGVAVTSAERGSILGGIGSQIALTGTVAKAPRGSEGH